VLFQNLKARPGEAVWELLRDGLLGKEEFGREFIGFRLNRVTAGLRVPVEHEMAQLVGQVPSLAIIVAL
jgi:hypothetical protein